MLNSGITPGAGAPSPQGNALMPQRPAMPQQPVMTPAQVQASHEHIADTLQEFDNLLKLPDDELDTKKIYGAAADLITKYRLSGGKRGADALTVAKELSDPTFPREGQDGQQPSPKALRQWIQKHFDRHAILQANLTAMFGRPQQPQANQQQMQMPQAQPNQMMMGAQ